ncbi:MAG: c-type cytochrome, partial [Planctomycetaceae bacterium]|nr:c-type cytochrome [Planctomycetaceae bacterium]
MGTTRICVAAVLVMVAPSWCAAWQGDEDDELRPGLVQRITVADQTAASIVSDPIVEPISTPAKTRYVWTGLFLIRGEGTHQFHAHLSGKVTVKLGERVVLDASANQPVWISGPDVELTFGEFPLEITADVENPGDRLKLYWSSTTFPLEPLPYHALFHADDAAHGRLVELGRDIVEAWNCRGCHAVERRQPGLSGPSLKTLGAGTDVAWLRERLTRGEPAAHSRMPAFGFAANDADAVLAYLGNEAKPPALPDVDVKRSEKEVAAGAQLIKSVGCLACHVWKELGKNPLLGGGPLDDVARHRSVPWLVAKLTDPHGVNPASRMPTFALSHDERRQIAAALSTGDLPKITPLGKGIKRTEELVARGRELVRTARCGACHELPGDVAPFEIAKPQAWSAVGGERSCTGRTTDPSRRQPRFAATFNDAIAAYLAETQSQQIAERSANFGERLLMTKGCLNCHDRNGSRGLSAITKDIVRTEPTWEGQSPTLQPPSLTAVGDRLPDELLAKGVRGELPRRMDWLKVRMPKFRHSDAEV